MRNNRGDDNERPKQGDKHQRLEEKPGHRISRAYFFHFPPPQEVNQDAERENQTASKSNDVT